MNLAWTNNQITLYPENDGEANLLHQFAMSAVIEFRTSPYTGLCLTLYGEPQTDGVDKSEKTAWTKDEIYKIAKEAAENALSEALEKASK